MMEKTVLVTGGTSGIGLAIAIYFKYLGYTVYATSRNPEKYDKDVLKQSFLFQNKNRIPKKIRLQLDQILDDISYIKLDITKGKSINACVKKIQAESEMVDILINNAGFSNFSSIEDNEPEMVERIFNTNVIGPIHLVKKVLPKMREKQAGTIVNITSMSGNQALPFMGIYSATKAAIMRITEALHLECNQFNIKATYLSLGSFRTNFNSNMLKSNNSNSNNSNKNNNNPDPVPVESPYSELGAKVWDFTENFFSGGTKTIKAAKKTAKIIKKRNPKASYQYARFYESVLGTLQKYGPKQFFLRLLNWFFRR